MERHRIRKVEKTKKKKRFNHETMEEDVVVYLGFDLERSKNTSRASQSRNFAEN